MLYLKYDRFNWGDRFSVMDENGKKYRVKSSVLLWNKKLQVMDMDKNLLFTIQAEPRSLLKKKFYIRFEDGREVAITRELSLIPKYELEGLDWEMHGVMLHAYEMLKNGQQVLSFEEMSALRYELNYPDPANELMALAVVLTITYAMNMGDGSSGTKA